MTEVDVGWYRVVKEAHRKLQETRQFNSICHEVNFYALRQAFVNFLINTLAVSLNHPFKRNTLEGLIVEEKMTERSDIKCFFFIWI